MARTALARASTDVSSSAARGRPRRTLPPTTLKQGVEEGAKLSFVPPFPPGISNVRESEGLEIRPQAIALTLKTCRGLRHADLKAGKIDLIYCRSSLSVCMHMCVCTCTHVCMQIGNGNGSGNGNNNRGFMFLSFSCSSLLAS